MTNEVKVHFTLIETEEGLNKFYTANKDVDWLCFDTEFVGEKRFTTLLCLIQISTVNGFYLIDPLKVKNIDPFLSMVTDPSILKITHAGDNEYRLLYQLYNITPRNVFDAQLAAGFVGYKYPISFRKLVVGELQIHLSKGYTVTDWESRPFSKKQLKYALDDVVYLRSLYEKLKEKLESLHRLEWVMEECSKWEAPAAYEVDNHREVLRSNLIHALKPHKQAFLMRLYAWREALARKQNYSRDMVLSGKLIGPIVKNINSGKAALMSNRIIPDRIVKRFWDDFNEMYQKPMTEAEQSFLRALPLDVEENPNQDLLMEMLFLLVKHKCLTQKIAPTLVIQRSILKKMRNNPNYFDESLAIGWRRSLLGDDLVQWLRVRNELDFEMNGDKCILRMKGLDASTE